MSICKDCGGKAKFPLVKGKCKACQLGAVPPYATPRGKMALRASGLCHHDTIITKPFRVCFDCGLPGAKHSRKAKA